MKITIQDITLIKIEQGTIKIHADIYDPQAKLHLIDLEISIEEWQQMNTLVREAIIKNG